MEQNPQNGEHCLHVDGSYMLLDDTPFNTASAAVTAGKFSFF